MEWEDMTTYRYGNKERKPQVIACKLTDSIILRVHKHIYYEDEWLLSCSFLGFDRRQLSTTDMEQAKDTALVVAYEELGNMGDAIKGAMLTIREAAYRGE